MENFSYLVEDFLAGSARPGLGGGLATDLDELADEGITAIVTLTEAPLLPPGSPAAEGRFALLHLPVPDFHPPSIEQIRAFVTFLKSQREDGGRVLVHCHAGMGRTGTMLAAWLISQGRTAREAVREVRAVRPGSIETESQLRVLEAWQRMVGT